MRLVEQVPGKGIDNVLYYFTPEEILTIERVGTTSPTDERRALTGESETMPTPEIGIPQTAQNVNTEIGKDMAAPASQPVDPLIADIRAKGQGTKKIAPQGVEKLDVVDDADPAGYNITKMEKGAVTDGAERRAQLDGAAGEGIRGDLPGHYPGDESGWTPRQGDLRNVAQLGLSDGAKRILQQRGVVTVDMEISADKAAFSHLLDEARVADIQNGWAVTPKTAEELAALPLMEYDEAMAYRDRLLAEQLSSKGSSLEIRDGAPNSVGAAAEGQTASQPIDPLIADIRSRGVTGKPGTETATEELKTAEVTQRSEQQKTKQLKNAAGLPIMEVKSTRTIAEPGSITQRVGPKGSIDRNFYGEDGKQMVQISNNGHGHKKEEAMGIHGEHAHDYFWDEDGNLIRGEARELTDEERRDNNDFL